MRINIANDVFKKCLYSFTSAFLFILSWPDYGFPFILFVAFVPLLLLQSKKNSIIYVFFSFALFAFGSFFWLCKISWTACLILIWQPFLMTLPFILYKYTLKRLSFNLSNLAFIAFWISAELLFFKWDYSIPWALLGNAFGNWTKTVQWYEYTGILGGTLWVLTVNILLFSFIQTKKKKWLLNAGFVILLPLLISYLLYNSYKERDNKIEVVLVQPNINPFTEKFPEGRNYIPFIRQMDILSRLANSKITTHTDYVIFPETAIIQGMWEDDIKKVTELPEIEKLIHNNPNVSLISGIETYAQRPIAKGQFTCAPRYNNEIGYYDLYNSIFIVDKNLNVNKQNKQRLIPFYEKVPFVNLGIVNNALQKFNIDCGLTPSELKSLLFGKNEMGIAPVICYESIYGEHVANLVNKGAKFIVIITNDGWWDNTAGKIQFFAIAKLRAIENRRSIARCANTGVTALIDSKGDVISQLAESKREALLGSINANSKITFYTKHGDFIGWLAITLSAFLLFITKISLSKIFNN